MDAEVDVAHAATIFRSDALQPPEQPVLVGEEEDALVEEDLESFDVGVLACEEDAGDFGATFSIVLAYGLDSDGLFFEDEVVDLKAKGRRSVSVSDISRKADCPLVNILGFAAQGRVP